MKKEWTVEELIEHLKGMPQSAKVKLEDADTNWTIHQFGVEEMEGQVWFFPSGYGEMTPT